MTKISIIVPCYNQGKYLSDALNSVLLQNYIFWECIVVNDGSNDETEQIALEWCKKDKRFIYIKNQNRGVSFARNSGIKIASGEYILPLDADDKIHSDYLYKALSVFEENYNTDLVYCKAEFFGEKIGQWTLKPYSFKELLLENMIFCSSLMKKEIMIRCGLYDESFAKNEWEDWEFLLRYLNPKSIVVQLPETLFYYRVKSNSNAIKIFANKELIKSIRSYVYFNNLNYFKEYHMDYISLFLEYRNLKKEVEVLKKREAYLLGFRKTSLKWITRWVLKFLKSLFVR